MSWNLNVFLKSLLFAFFGFLIGIVSTVIYLVVDVDLSKLDGLFIVIVVLIVITGWYAYTKKSLEIKETLMKLIINHYIAFVIIVLTVLISIAFFFLGTQYDELATNLVAEGIGVLITVIFLLYLLNLKEKYTWKKVENLIYELLGYQIFGIYLELSDLCVTHEPSLIIRKGYFETKMELNLPRLKNKDTITIDKDAVEPLKDGTYCELFNYRNNYLKSILSTHYKFLDSSIIKSLIIIQYAFEIIDMDVNTMKKRKEDDVLKELIKEDDLFNNIKMSMAKIFTEIDSLHEESNLEISF